jgi:tetratricopeptide (TPR) repeat protein
LSELLHDGTPDEVA